MCTVSYVPVKNGFFLTSNRDEKKTRATAIYPTVYHQEELKIIYPKDPDGQGSWIAINTAGVAIVLLNGAFVKHEHNAVYQKSRGLVLMEVISAPSPKDKLKNIILTGIEPFTIIICDYQSLTEFRWDGTLKHIKSLDPKKAKIWSSATLYDKKASLKRTEWFENWLEQNPSPQQKDIIDFHHFGGETYFEGLVINREMVKTVSITSLSLYGEKISMSYNDLQNEKHDEVKEVLY